MKFCVKCGKQMADNATFCGSCGAINTEGSSAGPAGGTYQPQPGPQSYGSYAGQQPAAPQPSVAPQPAPAPVYAQQPAQPQPQPGQAPAFVPASTAPQPAFGAQAPLGADAALAATVPARRGHGKVIAAIIAAVVAVAVGGTLAWAIPNVPAVRQLFGLGPTNPGAITMQALQSTQSVSSAKFSLNVDQLQNGKSSGSPVTLDGRYALGANTDASLFDVQIKDSASGTSGRLAWSGGALGLQITASGSDQYAYVDVNGLRDDLQEMLTYEFDDSTAKAYTDLVFNVKDALIKDGKVDGQGALKVFNDGMSAIDDEYAKEYKKFMPSDAVTKQYGDFASAFFTKGLEAKDVQSRVFPNKTESKGADGTTLEYDINVTELMHELGNYWQANQNAYPDLRQSLLDQFKDSSSNPEQSLNDEIKKLQEWKPEAGEPDSAHVSVTYGDGYQLNGFAVTMKGDDGETYRMELKVSDQNKVSADDPDSKKFMDSAKQNNDFNLDELMGGSSYDYGDYGSSYGSSSYYY